MRKTYDLPEKPCRHCGRPMRWRKKWARVWDEVRYCSERCRREARTKPGETAAIAQDPASRA